MGVAEAQRSRDFVLGSVAIVALMWWYSGSALVTSAVIAGLCVVMGLGYVAASVLLSGSRSVGGFAGSLWRVALAAAWCTWYVAVCAVHGERGRELHPSHAASKAGSINSNSNHRHQDGEGEGDGEIAECGQLRSEGWCWKSKMVTGPPSKCVHCGNFLASASPI